MAILHYFGFSFSENPCIFTSVIAMAEKSRRFSRNDNIAQSLSAIKKCENSILRVN